MGAGGDSMGRNCINSLGLPDTLRLMGYVVWVTLPIERPSNALMSMEMERGFVGIPSSDTTVASIKLSSNSECMSTRKDLDRSHHNRVAWIAVQAMEDGKLPVQLTSVLVPP
jgi:hypothetical protein